MKPWDILRRVAWSALEVRMRTACKQRQSSVSAAPAALMALLLLPAMGVVLAPYGEAEARAQQAEKSYVRMSVAQVGQVEGDIVVFLEDGPQKRLLPMGIGLAEGQAIQLGLRRLTPPRPLTHNLLESVIKALGSLQRLEIIELDGTTFIGRLTVKDARGREHRIDARPSDLAALSVNLRQPIWVARSVVDKASIPHPGPPPVPKGGPTPTA